MYEFFLWLMVSDSDVFHWQPPIDDDDDEGLGWDEKYYHIRDKIHKACLDSGVDFKRLNLEMTYGGMAVTAGFAINHSPPIGAERILLENIARLAPSSYGMIYFQDTDRDELGGKLNFLKLSGNNITEGTEFFI